MKMEKRESIAIGIYSSETEQKIVGRMRLDGQ